MRGPVEEYNHLQKEISKAKNDIVRLTAENKVALALGTEISEFLSTVRSIIGSLLQAKSPVVDPC